ncbi:hypothetical protein C8Q70DRAFT_934311 [Cubamyces menziesii]|nr:hypothetical protein C8Q70DRAFT_934311 [Cubamyces menziesii]
MKAFTAAVLTLFAFAAGVNAAAVEPGTDLATAISPFPVIDTALTNPDANLTSLEVSPCFWSGTAPFCAGACPAGSTAAARTRALAERQALNAKDIRRESLSEEALKWMGVKQGGSEMVSRNSSAIHTYDVNGIRRIFMHQPENGGVAV